MSILKRVWAEPVDPGNLKFLDESRASSSLAARIKIWW